MVEYAYVHVRIRGLEMLVFWKILRTYLMHDPFLEWMDDPLSRSMLPFQVMVTKLFKKSIFCNFVLTSAKDLGLQKQ